MNSAHALDSRPEESKRDHDLLRVGSAAHVLLEHLLADLPVLLAAPKAADDSARDAEDPEGAMVRVRPIQPMRGSVPTRQRATPGTPIPRRLRIFPTGATHTGPSPHLALAA